MEDRKLPLYYLRADVTPAGNDRLHFCFQTVDIRMFADGCIDGIAGLDHQVTDGANLFRQLIDDALVHLQRRLDLDEIVVDFAQGLRFGRQIVARSQLDLEMRDEFGSLVQAVQCNLDALQPLDVQLRVLPDCVPFLDASVQPTR